MNFECACSAYRMTDSCMTRICPETFKALKEACDKASSVALQLVADAEVPESEHEDANGVYEFYERADVDQAVAINKLWRAFYSEFEDKTQLEVFFNYHNPECGSREDDVNGWFIDAAFDSLFQMTPAQQKLQQLCNECPAELVRYVHHDL